MKLLNVIFLMFVFSLMFYFVKQFAQKTKVSYNKILIYRLQGIDE
jgi:hypothetical protein